MNEGWASTCATTRRWLPVFERFFHQRLIDRQLGAGIGSRVILRIRDVEPPEKRRAVE